jgi:hypothetical protein
MAGVLRASQNGGVPTRLHFDETRRWLAGARAVVKVYPMQKGLAFELPA